MPRRLPVRPAKIIGNLFVLFVLLVKGLIYYTYVFVVWGPRAVNNIFVMILLAFFHVFFILLIWSFFQSMTTDPGQVPVFWGFHLGDPENKRRRYCLMCNVFKPERCHHCSACNRCVLNMDHHCPWINNCVGFWNRKYFMLLLIYVLITTYFVFFSLIFDFIQALRWQIDTYYFYVSKHNQDILIKNFMIEIAFFFVCMIGILMTFFLKFHIYLVSSNKTTIENLDKKGKPYKSQYDIGPLHNWYQVFGTNKFLWPFPIFLGSGKPLGDGIYWPSNQKEEEHLHTQSPLNNQRQQISPNQMQSSSQNSNLKNSQIYQSRQQQQQQQYSREPQNQIQYKEGGGVNQTSGENTLIVFGKNAQRGAFSPVDVSNVPQNLQRYPQQQNAILNEQQNPDNRIIMHGDDNNREYMKRNLNLAIMQNHQRAQELSKSLNQFQQQQNKSTPGSSSVSGSGAIKGKGQKKKGTVGQATSSYEQAARNSVKQNNR